MSARSVAECHHCDDLACGETAFDWALDHVRANPGHVARIREGLREEPAFGGAA